MFQPNRKGLLAVSLGYDVYARVTYAPDVEVPFASVTLKEIAQKTTVRADSSASRGSADEIISKVKILVPTYVAMKIGDMFKTDGAKFLVSAKHPRYSVFGTHDHNEFDLEVTI